MTDRRTPPLRSRLSPRDRALRSVAANLRREQRGWAWPRHVRVGIFGGAYVELVAPTDPPADHALAADMVDALVERAQVAGLLAPHLAGSVWVVRPGDPVADADDRFWLREARRTIRERWLPDPGLWVVTKTGGTDLHTGVTRTWTRPRLP